MLKIVSIDQMRALEQAAGALGLPGPALMENAGRAIADVIRGRYPPQAMGQILVLVGPGNNGGDGLVVARWLSDAGYQVNVYLVGRPLQREAKVLLLEERGVQLIAVEDDPSFRQLDLLLGSSDLVVDALLGASRLRPITPPLADVADRVSHRTDGRPVVAVDVPSGIGADTGDADPHAVRADLTVTLGCPKRGLFLGNAARLAGALEVEDIGIPRSVGPSVDTWLADSDSIARLLPDRPRVSHKGSFGKVLVVAGSRWYTGAPVLAAVGAERIGAGLVTLACPSSIRGTLAAHTLETTFLPLPDDNSGELTPGSVEVAAEVLATYDAILVGPGIGRSSATADFLFAFLSRIRAADRPCVVDADALTLLAARERWWETLPRSTILTPHPGEMSRLTGQAEWSDRIEWARGAATGWSCTVVLKGAYTVVARLDGKAAVLPFANPALATAGTGDVLAGAIVGLLGQNLAESSAALVGAFVHGKAGERLARVAGSAGALASDLARDLPPALEILRKYRKRSLFAAPAEW